MLSFSPLWNYLSNVARSLLYSYVYGIILLITTVPIDFYYRFSSVCKKTPTMCQLILWLITIILLSFLETLPIYWFVKFGPDNDDLESETRILFEYFGWTSHKDIPNFIVISTARFSLKTRLNAIFSVILTLNSFCLL
jgi:hypothetical protein